MIACAHARAHVHLLLSLRRTLVDLTYTLIFTPKTSLNTETWRTIKLRNLLSCQDLELATVRLTPLAYLQLSFHHCEIARQPSNAKNRNVKKKKNTAFCFKWMWVVMWFCHSGKTRLLITWWSKKIFSHTESLKSPQMTNFIIRIQFIWSSNIWKV